MSRSFIASLDRLDCFQVRLSERSFHAHRQPPGARYVWLADVAELGRPAWNHLESMLDAFVVHVKRKPKRSYNS